MNPFVLRRVKTDPRIISDLPDKVEMRQLCNLTTEQASLYQAVVDRWLPRIEAHEDRFGRRGAVLAMLSQLKQVCNHPEMVVATGQALDGRSGKLERLVELLHDVPAEDKALVFTQYPGFDRLVPHLAERLGTDVGFFHGRLNARQRAELLEAFDREGADITSQLFAPLGSLDGVRRPPTVASRTKPWRRFGRRVVPMSPIPSRPRKPTGISISPSRVRPRTNTMFASWTSSASGWLPVILAANR